MSFCSSFRKLKNERMGHLGSTVKVKFENRSLETNNVYSSENSEEPVCST